MHNTNAHAKFCIQIIRERNIISKEFQDFEFDLIEFSRYFNCYNINLIFKPKRLSAAFLQAKRERENACKVKYTDEQSERNISVWYSTKISIIELESDDNTE